MKAHEVYLRAAEVVDEGIVECSCDAVSFVENGEGYVQCGDKKWPAIGPSNLATEYAALFKPRASCGLIWGREWGDDVRIDWKEVRDCRVQALLFMSEIAKGEE